MQLGAPIAVPTEKKVKTVWWNSSHDGGTHGTTLLHKILGRRDAFPFPKSIHLVRDTIATVCAKRPNAVIVDLFGGSATTYHATCMLNAEDGGKRQCVMVNHNEVGEKRAKWLHRILKAIGMKRWKQISRSSTKLG